jgi:hypothetical protein
VSRRSVYPLSRRASVGVLLVAMVTLGAFGTACSGDDDKDAKDAKDAKETTTTTVTFKGTDSAEFCAQYQQFITTNTSASLDPATVPPEELATRWAASVTALQGMEAAASDEIKADIGTVAKAIEDLQPALAAVGYDPTKVPAAERKRFQTEAANEASNRVTEYGTQVCGAQNG